MRLKHLKLSAMSLSAILTMAPMTFACEDHTQSDAPVGKIPKAHASIQLAPVMNKNIRFTVSDGGECSYPGIPCMAGSANYEGSDVVGDAEYYNSLTIVSEPQVQHHGAFEHKKSLTGLKQFLAGGTLPNANIYDSNRISALKDDLPRVFDDCLDYACPVIQEIGGVTIPGMDATRAVLTMDGQDLLGQPHVRIYAQKGKQYLQLSGDIQLPYEELMASTLKSCEAIANKSYSDDADPVSYADATLYCASKAMQADAKLKIMAEAKAKELIERFHLGQ